MKMHYQGSKISIKSVYYDAVCLQQATVLSLGVELFRSEMCAELKCERLNG